ncbi:melanoma-associated antigen B16-like [Choloepus didactylus]|uniref:melanoma-associated antigen B16-like n=1 Tax=Choloepus didactylus TaxID=27675 RepID=UPI00189D79E6|nr:melanoma-associated antigen B16-like [Choloepus didactylus]
MSQGQESPRCTQEQQFQSCIKSKGLEVSEVPKSKEEASSSSSYPPIPGNLGEIATAGMPSTPQVPQSAHSPTAMIATSSSKSDEGSSSQEEDGSVTSQSPPDTENLPMETLDEKVTLLIQFLLQNYQMNEPITKADMLNIVIKECKDDFLEILKRASECMELVFGVDVKEVNPTDHRYALVNKLDLTYNASLSGDDGMPKTSLLIIILGVIFMKGNRASEEEIWEVLNMMDLYSGKKHFIFGEPRKFITKDLVQEKYLEYRKVYNSDPPCYEFLWGPRAHAETSKMKLLEFLTKIHESDPRCFPFQYEEALRDEVQRARAQARAAARAATATKTRASSNAKPSRFSCP